MIKKAIICSIFFTIGLTLMCFGEDDCAAEKVETIEKGVTLYELEETGQQFFVCSKGKTVVFVPDEEFTDEEPTDEKPTESPTEPSSEEPTEEEPTEPSPKPWY